MYYVLTVLTYLRLHVRMDTLLSKSCLASYNRMAVKAIAVETWKAVHSCDGPNGARNPLGALLTSSCCRPSSESNNARFTTRSATNGLLPYPMRHFIPTFACHARRIWNASLSLRTATSLTAAKKAATELAMLASM